MDRYVGTYQYQEIGCWMTRYKQVQPDWGFELVAMQIHFNEILEKLSAVSCNHVKKKKTQTQK